MMFSLPSIFLPGGDWFTGWLPLVFLVTLTVIFFYGLVFMVSKAFNFEQLQRAAISEIYNTFATFFLAIFLVTFLTAAFNFFSYFFGSSTVVCDAFGKISITSSSPVEVIRCKLSEKAAILSELYEKVLVSAREPFSDFYRSWGILGFPIYYQGSYIWQTEPSSLYYEVENYRLLNSVIVTLLIGINAYLGSINYVANNMLTVFLPVGIVLRAIPFTRSIGALLISLAIGLYFIYPFLFILTDPVFIKPDIPYLDIKLEKPELFWPTFKGVVAFSSLPSYSTATRAFNLSNVEDIAKDLSQIYYFFIVHPIILLSMTLIIVRYLVFLFGGEGFELYRLAMRVI